MSFYWPKRLCILLLSGFVSCNPVPSNPSKESVSQLALKRGPIISCGADNNFGRVRFKITGNEKQNSDFNTAVQLLHSFEYDEAEKAFAKIIDESPKCAMAYWGVAMSTFHPLWEPPSESDLKKGAKAVELARSIKSTSKREDDYINAIGAYYKNWQTTTARARSINFQKAMEEMYRNYPEEKEAAIFYALALDAAADGTDKSYSNQKKAGAILEGLYKKEPNHPGIVHYIIHTYDYPGIASRALPAARKYASVAPSSAHALHMPSHIFTRLGLWNDCIQSNLKSAESAKCYAEAAGIKGVWDEEMHALDYLVYAYLQKGDNASATEQLSYISSIPSVVPLNFKAAYTFAAAPSRMALENKNWKAAANLPIHPANFPWNKFPWQQAIHHFTRLLGAAHTSNLSSAETELKKLKVLVDTLTNQKDLYKAKQVAIQLKAGEAWILFMHGNKTDALALMSIAADMEDSTTKHPVTPGEVLPARELYADMLLAANENGSALREYEKALLKSPNRFNSLYGAAVAAQKTGATQKALSYFKQFTAMVHPASKRPELSVAKEFLNNHR